MAVTQQQQPQECHINGGGQQPIGSMISKRRRRPSVRLGEIGDLPAAVLAKNGKPPNKVSKNRPLTNLSTQEEEQAGDEKENSDNLAIGNWKFKGSKSSKRAKTNWVSKLDEGGENNADLQDGFSRDFEMDEESLDLSMENERDLNFRVTHNSSFDDGVRVWLNGLGLERYWPVFKIHEVDEEGLPLLTLEDLKDTGINAVGSRRKMFCAIQKLNKVFS